MALAKDKSAQPIRTVVGISGTAVDTPYSEAGIGSLMPWANRLWFANYPDTNGDGAGLGLWSMGKDMVARLEFENNKTDAARIINGKYAVLGRHAIDNTGVVTEITGFAADQRVTAYGRLFGSAFLWALTMAGHIYRVDMTTLTATVVNTTMTSAANLNIVGLPHGKAMWGHPSGRYLFVALNGSTGNGRLAVYDVTKGGSDGAWTNIDTGNNSWIEVAGCYEPDWNKHIYASGHDGLSGLLWVFNGTTYNPTPAKYRIPLSTDQMKHTYQQEWQRIRAVETERFLMDQHGGFFQLSPLNSGNDAYTDLPRLEPIARHLRTIPDFCSWNGHFVLAGNQNTPQALNVYPNVGQSYSGLLLTTTDDIWSWGKPAGTGYWYRNASIAAGALSDLMLLRGYNDKELHLVNGTASAVNVDVMIRMNGLTAPFVYTTLTVPAGGHAGCVLPAGDWVQVRPAAACTDLTAYVVYT